MSKRAFRYLALGFLVSAVILAGYRAFLYPKQATAKKDDSQQTTTKKKDKTLSASEKSYKKKYEELLLQTEMNSIKEDKDDTSSTEVAASDKDKKTADKAKADEKKKADKAKAEEKKKADEKKKETAKPEENKEYTLVIASGEASGSAIQRLKENGIIEDTDEFTKFLHNNDYESKVRDGTYKVKKGMSYDQLAQIMTGQ